MKHSGDTVNRRVRARNLETQEGIWAPHSEVQEEKMYYPPYWIYLVVRKGTMDIETSENQMFIGIAKLSIKKCAPFPQGSFRSMF